MSARTVDLRIFRFKPGVIDPPRYDVFRVAADGALTVLDALERIRLGQDPTLIFRHSCHHSACGTCACRVNGIERLACTTRLLELDSDTVALDPLRGYAPVGDLAVDMAGFFRDIDPHWTTLKPCEAAPQVPAQGPLMRFEDCIECGICVSACPAAAAPAEFMGPAALAAIHNELEKQPQARRELLAAAGGPRGERLCERALACSRRCPTRVYPAARIESLRRALSEKVPP
jgi:succinate dehydrogenase / fumarate reductase iron-sulfur subunit